MGIIPLWGFQLAIAIAGAFLLRLNKALVIIAANISIPPMIPLILFLSHTTGSMLMGANAQHLSFSDDITLELVHDNFIQYVLGAISLAVVSGVVATGLTFVGLKIMKRTHA